MSTTTVQRQQIHAAFMAAFSVDDLRRLVRYALDVELDAISTGNLEQRTFDVIDYAEKFGRLSDLVTGGVRQNPGNEKIQQLIGQALFVQYGQKKTPTPITCTVAA